MTNPDNQLIVNRATSNRVRASRVAAWKVATKRWGSALRQRDLWASRWSRATGNQGYGRPGVGG